MQAAELAQVERLLGAEALAVDWLTQLRQELPGRAITMCDAADMTEGRPYRAYPDFEIYLVDGSGHCWYLTEDADSATGLVVAKRRRRAGA